MGQLLVRQASRLSNSRLVPVPTGETPVVPRPASDPLRKSWALPFRRRAQLTYYLCIDPIGKALQHQSNHPGTK